ncbi:MAG: rod shape-determining protein RodA [Candidatus Calescibacterium sp.]|nr:rod shape-determining protein RodA [Candidatus Calescibacterium sp.]
MSREQKSIFENVDWILIGLYLVLVLLGWLNIYAAVYNEEHRNIWDISQKYGKQLLWIGGALLIAFSILIIAADFYSAFAFPIYGLSLLSLIAVAIFGTEIGGSRSWFRIGEFGIQPAEFAKFATAMALAKFLSNPEIRFTDLRTKIISFIIILLPALLIYLQKEAGTALIFAAFVFVLYREGLSGNILLGGLFVILLFFLALLVNKLLLFLALGILTLLLCGIIWFFSYNKKSAKRFIVLVITLYLCSGLFIYGVDYGFHQLKPHQQSRINIFLGKETDKDVKKKAGYNIHQSLVAIGSGGFLGKGYLQGTQTKYDFVPEQSTDFIFCTVGEEWGFVGSTIVLLLFLALMLRIIYVAERQRSVFSRIYGYGVASILFLHVAINVGMTIGLAPIIGIPLPFFSYGGSSLWGFTILLFIFIKMDSHRLLIFR